MIWAALSYPSCAVALRPLDVERPRRPMPASNAESRASRPATIATGDQRGNFTRRGLLLGAGQLALFGGLGARFYQLQVMSAPAMRRLPIRTAWT